MAKNDGLLPTFSPLCPLLPVLDTLKVGRKWPKNNEKWAKIGQKWAKIGIFYGFCPFAHFYSYIMCESLQFIYKNRKTKWANGHELFFYAKMKGIYDG